MCFYSQTDSEVDATCAQVNAALKRGDLNASQCTAVLAAALDVNDRLPERGTQIPPETEADFESYEGIE